MPRCFSKTAAALRAAVFICLLTAPLSALAVQLDGGIVQGGIVFGKAAPGSSVRLDGREIMVVVPASRHVDLDAVAAAADASKVRLATEEEFQARFPDCEVGAMPPFGNLYYMPVYLDTITREVDDICFNAGSHTQIVRMSCDDYVRLVKPVVGSFAIKE